MDDQLKANLTSSRHWTRLLFMVLFAVILQVAALVMWALVAVQFLWALVTGSDNHKLRRFGQSLARYIFEALEFLTYNTEHKPFPFADWPEIPPADDEPVAAPTTASPARAAADAEIIRDTRDVVEDIKNDDETGAADASKA